MSPISTQLVCDDIKKDPSFLFAVSLQNNNNIFMNTIEMLEQYDNKLFFFNLNNNARQ